MKAPARVVIGLVGATAWLLVLGFMLFAAAVMRAPQDGQAPADGIVVLTGTDHRIVEGARLLKEGRAKRLLISGVNRRTKREDVHRISGLDDMHFACCVDLGYEALTTAGNAEEAGRWAGERGYRSLIVVTSNYHMPRSLLVFSLSMPDTRFIPHPVPTKGSRPTPWWLHLNTTRVLISEYFKFLPTAAWHAVSRTVHPVASRASLAPETPKPEQTGVPSALMSPVAPQPGLRRPEVK